MIVWQANLGRGGVDGEYERNLRRVLEAAGPRAVIGFQEIDEADRPEEMDTLIWSTRKTHQIAGANTAVPILVPNHLDIEDETQTLACKGLAEFTPHRPINEVRIRIGKNLAPVALCGHMPIKRDETESRRRDFRRTLRERANANLEHGGLWIADTNTRRGWPRIVPGEVSVVDAGIDKTKAWAPPGRKVVVTDRQTVRLTIDNHDAHGARVRFERI